MSSDHEAMKSPQSLEPGRPDVMPVSPPENREAGGDDDVPLPADDESPVDEDMSDVEANNAVSSEYPEQH
ncbi:hypothetical protein [Pseudomonas sp. NPDC090208]|uniref:hypothetical protein n=1 Tax=Pseudomonas sp. NPDC090208 TaxID=3364478 RepID=UPI003815B15E